MKLLHI